MYKVIYKIILWAFCVFFAVEGMGQRIPVVFHIISQNPSAITDQQVIDAVADLNDAFAHAGVYGFGPGANTGISFCLAQKDPLGGNTNGITRTISVLGDFDVDIEDKRTKNLVSWDTREYCNIWYVDGLQSEIYPMYSCGIWTRMKEAGYATTTGGADFRDGIVITGFGALLAHEMGHYLGLMHTFTIGNCTNNNCDTDGDGICDTPPTSVFGGSCISPQNSCSTDTLSGFPIDVADLNANFMSYSACTNMFTNGQGIKMRNMLAGPRNSLLLQDKCNKPCNENILAGFTRDNWFPSTGSTINFTSTSTGGSVYQWTVDGALVGANSPNLSYSFPANGKYAVTLKVYNGNAACYASYTDYVIVTCGVMARFYPDKRIIASKAPIMVDSILFTNRSVNSTSWQWLMSNNTGMAEQIVGTSFNLNYVFDSSGNYSVRLISSNGPCADTTEYFNFRVDDPTADGTVSMTAVECFQQTKIKLSITVCNNGYANIPAGIPISFYDADPRNGNANKLDSTFILPDTVKGQCCGKAYSIIVDVKRIGLNTIYAVFNDNGTSIPWKLPNTSLREKNYDNNISVVSGFKFKVSIIPPTASLVPGDTLVLTSVGIPGSIASYDWSPAQYLSCTSCASPLFLAVLKGNATKKLIAVSANACIDSAFSVIKIIPSDDYTVSINSIKCSRNDSLRATFSICNLFKGGTIPKGLKLSFYNGDPNTPSAQLMGPVFIVPNDNPGKCAMYTHVIKGVGAQIIFAVVNDKGTLPHILPNDSISLEKDYSNNMSSFSYQPDSVVIHPSDTSIYRSASVQLHATYGGGALSSIDWTPAAYISCTSCLDPLVNPPFSQQYILSVKNAYGCIATDTAMIRTFTNLRVNIPNAFTPNGDGKNDIFYILGSRDIELVSEFLIFNRYGQKVFGVSNVSPNNPVYGWNGSVNGRAGAMGTYVYSIMIRFTDNSSQVYKGTITLLR